MSQARLCDVTSTDSKPVYADMHDQVIDIPVIGRYRLDLSERGAERLEALLAKHAEAVADYEEELRRLEEEMERRRGELQTSLLAKSGLNKVLKPSMRVDEEPAMRTHASRKGTKGKGGKKAHPRLVTEWGNRVRVWARKKREQVNDKGRIPAELKAKYEQAHPDDLYPA